MTHSNLRPSFPSRWLALACLLFLASTVLAQGATGGSVDVAGKVGFSDVVGVDNNKHVSFGGAVAYNLSPQLAVGGEFDDLPLGSVTSSGVTAGGSMKLFGSFLRFSLTKSRISPFVSVAGGGALLDAVGRTQGISVSAGDNGAYFGLGGGATFFVGANSNWGIRPEFRYSREQFSATTIGSTYIPAAGQNDVRGTVSVFYQFGGKHSQSRK